MVDLRRLENIIRYLGMLLSVIWASGAIHKQGALLRVSIWVDFGSGLESRDWNESSSHCSSLQIGTCEPTRSN